MTDLKIENGVCIAFGGTNARMAEWSDGDIANPEYKETPNNPDEFFGWMARSILRASDRGARWVVAGFPGPVSPDGKIIGPMENVNGLDKKEYDVAHELTKADPAAGRLLEAKEDFTLMDVNDGSLAAHAVAARIAQLRHNSVAALIIGTGQGAGVVRRDRLMPAIFREDRENPLETGHSPIDPWNPEITFENLISGPAIERRTGINDARDIPAAHPIWKEVGGRAGQLTTFLGLMNGVELVVPTGGVGAGGSDKFRSHMEAMLALVREGDIGPQKKFLPDVAYIDPKDANVFEMFGAGSVMADYLTRTQ